MQAVLLLEQVLPQAIYVGYNNSKIEYQDKINEYRERIIVIGKQHEKEIHDYNLEISTLTNEINDLKQQIRQLKEKEDEKNTQ